MSTNMGAVHHIAPAPTSAPAASPNQHPVTSRDAAPAASTEAPLVRRSRLAGANSRSGPNHATIYRFQHIVTYDMLDMRHVHPPRLVYSAKTKMCIITSHHLVLIFFLQPGDASDMMPVDGAGEPFAFVAHNRAQFALQSCSHWQVAPKLGTTCNWTSASAIAGEASAPACPAVYWGGLMVGTTGK